jgi:AcrR family transcriptional regulator
MPRSGADTHRRILQSAHKLFRRKGYARISMDEIASATRVTKRTLYQHFESKDALLSGVLQADHELALIAFETYSHGLTGSPNQIINSLFEELIEWADRPRWAGSGFTRLVIELADLPGHPARTIARRHKAILEAKLAELFEKAKASRPQELAREVTLLIEGAMLMMLVHRDCSYALAAAKAAIKLVRLRRQGS